MNKARSLRIVLYAVLIFLAGAATGVLVAPIIGRTFMRPPRPEEMAHHMMERLRSGLSLTDSQVAEIQPLVERTGVEMETIRRQTMQQVRRRIEETNTKILALLTPEQQVKFKKMEAEHRDRLRRNHPLGEPPGPPPPSR